MVEAGTLGCMTAAGDVESWRQVIRSVLAGRSYVSAALTDEILGADKAPHQTLSQREFELLCYIGEGWNVQQIAAARDRSVVTVRKARRNVLKKMKMTTDGELIRYALQWALVE